MSGFIEWDRSAFLFMKEGVPRNKDKRLGTDDDILELVSSEDRAKVLSEVQ